MSLMCLLKYLSLTIAPPFPSHCGGFSNICTMKYLPQNFVMMQVKIVSAHRTPEMMFSYALSARERGIQVIIAGAGGAAHLPGLLSYSTK